MKGTSKHLKRKSNRARHNKKVKRGGAKWITGANRTDLIHLWNSLFYERAKTRLKLKIEDKMVNERNLYGRKTKALFVIDMQNDFVDRVYDRENDKHPIHKTSRDIGNFAVSGGATMLNPNSSFITFLNNAIDEYDLIVFSRDYHPVGHNSFNKSDFFEKNLCGGEKPLLDNDPENGNFPAHCVQGSNGSLFVPEVEEFIKKHQTNDNKIKIVFKGIHKDVDSFTAVPVVGNFHIVDHIASNKNGGCNCGGDKNLCSTITGGYTLNKPLTESISFNRSDGDYKQAPYNDWLKNIKEIDVCGLAGDYCVRDTIMSLAKKYTEKIVRLLAEHTRYAVLPYKTILTLPQHVQEEGRRQKFNNDNDSGPPYMISKIWDVTTQYGLNDKKNEIKDIKDVAEDNKVKEKAAKALETAKKALETAKKAKTIEKVLELIKTFANALEQINIKHASKAEAEAEAEEGEEEEEGEAFEKEEQKIKVLNETSLIYFRRKIKEYTRNPNILRNVVANEDYAIKKAKRAIVKATEQNEKIIEILKKAEIEIIKKAEIEALEAEYKDAKHLIEIKNAINEALTFTEDAINEAQRLNQEKGLTYAINKAQQQLNQEKGLTYIIEGKKHIIKEAEALKKTIKTNVTKAAAEAAKTAKAAETAAETAAVEAAKAAVEAETAAVEAKKAKEAVEEKAAEIFLAKAKDIIQDKDITYYMIKYENNTFRLMEKQELHKITTVEAMQDKDKDKDGNPIFTKYQHFITPIEYIIEDYLSLDNIRIYLPQYGECKELYSEKPLSKSFVNTHNQTDNIFKNSKNLPPEIHVTGQYGKKLVYK